MLLTLLKYKATYKLLPEDKWGNFVNQDYFQNSTVMRVETARGWPTMLVTKEFFEQDFYLEKSPCISISISISI